MIVQVTLALQSMIKLLGRMFGAKFWDNAVLKVLMRIMVMKMTVLIMMIDDMTMTIVAKLEKILSMIKSSEVLNGVIDTID